MWSDLFGRLPQVPGECLPDSAHQVLERPAQKRLARVASPGRGQVSRLPGDIKGPPAAVWTVAGLPKAAGGCSIHRDTARAANMIVRRDSIESRLATVGA